MSKGDRTNAGPPVPPPSYVARARLDDALVHVLDHRLTCVVAETGFGKSTLLSSFATRVNCAWYAVTGDDSSVDSFVRGLLESLAARVPNIPSHLAASAVGADLVARPERLQAIAGLVSGVLRNQLTDLVLVLEDIHEMPADSPSVGFIEALCRHAPATFHVLLSSRTDLPFSVRRLRETGDLLELGAAELAFSLEETAMLLVTLLGPLGRDLADRVHSYTAGWPAAVHLVAQHLAALRPDARHEALETAGELGGRPLSSTVEIVIMKEPDDVRSLLRTVAALESFSPDMCRALGFEQAPATFDRLYRSGVLVERRGTAPWYRLNALFAEFLRKHHPLDDEERQTLSSRASDWYEANGHIALALRTAYASSDEERMGRLLAGHGDALIAGGQAEDVLQAASRLTTRFVDQRVARVVGDAHLRRGEFADALSWFEGIDAEPAAPHLAWRIGLIYAVRGDIPHASEAFDRARPSPNEPREEAMLFAWRAQIDFLRSDAEACRADAERAMELATAAGDDLALAAAHTAHGVSAVLAADPVAEKRHWALGLECAERAGDVQWIIRIRNQRATRRVIEDAYDEARKDLDAVLDLSEATGSVDTHALALTTRAAVDLMVGKLDEALVDIMTAVAGFDRFGSPAASYAYRLLGDVQYARGAIVASRAAYERAIDLARASGRLYTLAIAIAGLARVVAEDDAQQASSLIHEALAIEEAKTNTYVQTAAAWVALSAGNKAEAYERSVATGATADRVGAPAVSAECLELSGLSCDDKARARSDLERAVAIWTDIGAPLYQARAELALAGVVDPSTARDLSAGAFRTFGQIGARRLAARAADVIASLDRAALPPVSIVTLGGFAVERDGVRVPLNVWQSRKARDLLKMLVARRGRPVPREVLIDELWPGEDPVKAGNRLSVALSTIRSVLDPNKQFPADRFVIGDRGAIALATSTVAIDLEGFLADAARGLAGLQDEAERRDALDRLAHAEATYAGDFLEEDVYEEWSVAIREEARATYVAIARTLADDAATHRDEEATTRYLLRILQLDSYDESAYIELVASLDRAGRHGEARRWYRRYSARMREIDVEAAPYPTPARARTA